MLKGSSDQEDAVFDVESARCVRWRPACRRQHSGYIADGRQQFYGSRWKRMEDGYVGKDGFRRDVSVEVVYLGTASGHAPALTCQRTVAAHTRHG